MDVDNDASVQIGADHNLAREGRLDVAVNNAGIDYAGSIEDLTLADAHQLLETNFFGLLRVCRGVLPVMRRQGEGLMVNVTSIGAQITLTFRGHSTAS